MGWGGPGDVKVLEVADKEDDVYHQDVGIDFCGLCCSLGKETSSYDDGWM